MYLLPTVSIFYVQVELCHIFRDYDGRWQISDRGETRHKYYGTKSLFVLPWILADEIIFIVSYQTMKYKFNYTPLVKFLNFAVVKIFSWTDQPRPISKCKMVLETYFRRFAAKSEVRIFQKMTICI